MAYCKDETNKERFLGIKATLDSKRGSEESSDAAN
jgi:hypothetical protein